MVTHTLERIMRVALWMILKKTRRIEVQFTNGDKMIIRTKSVTTTPVYHCTYRHKKGRVDVSTRKRHASVVNWILIKTGIIILGTDKFIKEKDETNG